ncbi:Uncharacterised protein [Vibrio cholerae]|uniref:Uncharacterized protein n=1 Tax=Vibrio cholerae TaxID=666 RepID=A0A655WHN5_VIBCL|nr:Uncharacterised protein [Vibrio cholerae]CSC32856.1 Uncharacterised protein [Vibrio cholerae]CSC60990.1 Uncharacterised protein [Vibrio cholerae]CSD03238.1 Uncharacterised protein [Vibrio cholerae]CSI58446.1 Uncharacterised protein [Vibrio cholerae]
MLLNVRLRIPISVLLVSSSMTSKFRFLIFSLASTMALSGRTTCSRM